MAIDNKSSVICINCIYIKSNCVRFSQIARFMKQFLNDYSGSNEIMILFTKCENFVKRKSINDPKSTRQQFFKILENKVVLK